MQSFRKITWKYAPLWAVGFAGAATLAKSLGQRYILQREVELKWSDAAAAAIGAVLGYVTLRRHAEDMEGDWYKR